MSATRAPKSPRFARTAGRLLLATALAFAAPAIAHALPSYDDVRGAWRSTDWVLLARDGTPLQRTRVDLTERRGDWVSLADVSPAFREAIVVSRTSASTRTTASTGAESRVPRGAICGTSAHAAPRR